MSVDALLDQYDSGHINRRQLLQALAGIGLTQGAAPSVFTARTINHVALFVEDARRSQEFYQRTFGLSFLGSPRAVVTLSVGDDAFLGIAQQPGKRIDHLCFGMDGYSPQQDLAKAKAAGLDATLDANDQLYVRDPDGFRVQIAARTYRGV